MDVEQLRQDVAEGNVSFDRLVALIASQQKLIEKLPKQVAALQEKIDGKSPTERLDEQCSEKAEEKRQAKGKKRKRPKSTIYQSLTVISYKYSNHQVFKPRNQ